MAETDRKTLVQHLTRIERYMQGCELLRFPPEPSPLRRELCEFLRRSLPKALDHWLALIAKTFEIPPEEVPGIRQSMEAAQLRWFRHIEDPSDIETYEHLREHTRGGFISRFPASRFLASQMKMTQCLRGALIKEHRNNPEKAGELVALLDQEFQERVLHITDFFVEARIEELDAQEASFRQTIENAPAPIFQVDFDDGTIRSVNRVAERVTGYARSELLGLPIWDVHPPEERTRARKHWAETRSRGHLAADDLHLLHRSGRAIPVFINSGVIEYGKNKFIQRICVDLSDRKRLESQLVQSEKMAAIGQLAAGVAHEIRNPLNAMRLALYDLREILTEGPEEAKEDLRIAEEELRRAKAIIDSLLEFSRVSQVEAEPVYLNVLLEKTLILMNKYLQNSHVEVVTEFGTVPACMANENEIRQVVLNLITNAVQAMPYGGRLRLRTRQIPGRNGDEARVVLEVSDSGVGIPPEHLKDIFNPFFTTKEPGQGTGLGLSVVDSIVRRTQGEIHVESKVGQGTTFHLEFPCNCATDE